MSDSNSNAQKAWMSSGPSMYREPSDRMPLDLFSYTREAKHCLDNREFLASILMSSSAVELILNRDRRLRACSALDRKYGWANLNNGNLRVARDNGLPADLLLEHSDNLDSGKPIAFVQLRNKVAHGEVEPFLKDLSDYDPSMEQAARYQGAKMRQFVSAWFNTAPDVLNGHIKNHRWSAN